MMIIVSCVRCVNDCLKVSDPESEARDREVRLATPPSDKLVSITTNMNTNLTALLAILQVDHSHTIYKYKAPRPSVPFFVNNLQNIAKI